MVRVEKLSRRFDNMPAVNGLNLEIRKGEIFGLVGPDGAGKTTTLRLLSGLLDPSDGRIEVAGHTVGRKNDAVKDVIGYMAQRFGLYLDLTVEENLFFYADLFGLPQRQLRDLMAQLLQMTRMKPFLQRRAGQLSGGMKQKLSLMCALLHRPQVLFLDEPTNGVDPISRREFWSILYQLVKEGMTVLITTAYLDEAERCSRVGFMYQGEMIRCDTPERLVSDLEEACYEVRCGNRRFARTVLMGEPGVVSVELSGATLHLFLSSSGPSLQLLTDTLRRAGVAPADFQQIQPSLEDVFILLVRRREAETG